METPIYSRMGLSEEAQAQTTESVLSRIPLARMGQLSEIAKSVHFPASNDGNFMVVSGIVVGVLAWLGMMIGFMPVTGNGLFVLGISPMVTMATPIVHILFSAVLGYTYSKLAGQEQVAIAT